jgi:hypothetical protein
MRFILAFVLIYCVALVAGGQDIHTIVLSSIEADEPPTKQGRSEFTITFQHDGEIWKSSQQVTIDDRQVRKIRLWRAENKKLFMLSELGVTYDELSNAAPKFALTFDITKEFVVNIDSFVFCQGYKMTRTISTGGYSISTKLIYENGTEDIFKFDSDDLGNGSFDLQGYLFCHTLFKDAAFTDRLISNFFSKENLKNTILKYQKMVECEGFYYKEFVSKNPGRSSKENRMMTGWNFADYKSSRDFNVEKLRSCQAQWKYHNLDSELTGTVTFYEQPIVFCGVVSTASVGLIKLENGSLVRVLTLCNAKGGFSVASKFKEGDKVKITSVEKPEFRVDLVPYDPKACDLDEAFFGNIIKLN